VTRNSLFSPEDPARIGSQINSLLFAGDLLLNFIKGFVIWSFKIKLKKPFGNLRRIR
jgi:hypothetical protein